MKLITIKEQLNDAIPFSKEVNDYLISKFNDDESLSFSVMRKKEEALCLNIHRVNDVIKTTTSYFIGVNWIIEKELAVNVRPKLNDGFEINYIKMLNEALSEPENFKELKDLIYIDFDKPSIDINEQYDILSILLVTEFLNILKAIVNKGLMKSYHIVEENLHAKIKGKMHISANINKNLSRGNFIDNVCFFQTFDEDNIQNRILKKALHYCIAQLDIYKHAVDTTHLTEIVRYVKPAFASVGDRVAYKELQTATNNHIFFEYTEALRIAKLLLKRFSYSISEASKLQYSTPPFWLDMSKLFELYIFRHLRSIFKTKGEIRYHEKANYQELDFLLNCKNWNNPYVIDAKYKPYYKDQKILTDDVRQVSGYARLSKIYHELKLNEETALPIKCLIIYPDQNADEGFSFNDKVEPEFEKVPEYIRFYKIGIKLPIIAT